MKTGCIVPAISLFLCLFAVPAYSFDCSSDVEDLIKQTNQSVEKGVSSKSTATQELRTRLLQMRANEYQNGRDDCARRLEQALGRLNGAEGD